MAASTSPGQPAISAESVRDWLVGAIAGRRGIAVAQVPADRHLQELGVDSTDTLVLISELAKWTGVELDPAALWYFPTVALLADHVASQPTRAA